ncbi:Uncharacterised protein [Faecalibacterium prausnitzii]|nr:Uncharacterised protein [Faecalibacterium prausnitzii]
MNDRENDKMRETEGRQIQQELENQMRAFGDTVSDAFAHGFEGRGMEIGDRAWGVGKAAVHAAKHIFGLKNEQTPVELLRADGKKRSDAGVALLVVGITFTVIFGLGTLGCLIGLGTISPAALGDVVVSTAEGGGILMTGTDYAMNTAYNVLGIVGGVLGLATAGFGWMTACGAARMKAGRQMGQFADYADSVDYHKGLPVSMLADLTHQKPKKVHKRLQKYIRKGWLNAWLDDKTDTLYLTAEDYRAAQEALAAQRARPAPQPEQEAAPETPLNLETARRFAKVLEQEQQLMQDAQGAEELAHMQKTTEAICDWLETHPESLPKARRFAEYYIPTTLKLLHTYNDVQGQKGDNAESIRRDIAGILHTLNQAYSNLYDNLLSDVALDVSSEIAALQGMLANDGLTGEGLQ